MGTKLYVELYPFEPSPHAFEKAIWLYIHRKSDIKFIICCGILTHGHFIYERMHFRVQYMGFH